MPYVICNLDQLNHMVSFCDATAPNDCLGVNFILGANIDLAGQTFNPLDSFRGKFDGNEKTISNWTYVAADAGDNAAIIEADIGAPTPHVDFNLGFFRALDDGGSVKDLTLSNVDLKGRFSTGAIIGYMMPNSSIDNVHATTNGVAADVNTTRSGIIIGFNDLATGGSSGHTGGLVGLMDAGATISNSSFSGLVRGAMQVGGIVGLTNGVVTKSHAAGASRGRDGSQGGITGELAGAVAAISQSYSTMTIKQSVGIVGGLVGVINGGATMTTSYFNGVVEGGYGAGGLVGRLRGAGSMMSKCYALGSVSGSANVGGAIGWLHSAATVEDSFTRVAVAFTANSVHGLDGGGGGFAAYVAGATLTRVYASGVITNNTGAPSTSMGDLVGGLAAGGTIVDSFADDSNSTTALVGSSNAGTTTDSSSEAAADMKVATLYTAEGWDFSGVWKFKAGVNGGFPILR